MLACVADRVGLELWSPGHLRLREQFEGVPCSGNSKLLAGRSVDRYISPVIAVFDDDKVRELMGLQSEACKREVLKAIREKSEIPEERLIVVLLDRNMETVVAACCRAFSEPEPRRKPKPRERDAILHKAAQSDAAKRTAIANDAATATFKRLVGIVERFAGEA